MNEMKNESQSLQFPRNGNQWENAVSISKIFPSKLYIKANDEEVRTTDLDEVLLPLSSEASSRRWMNSRLQKMAHLLVLQESYHNFEIFSCCEHLATPAQQKESEH